MASTEIPTATPNGLEPDEDALQDMSEFELHEAPVVLLELQDKRARSRLREALWLSLIVHLAVIIMIATSPHWAFPRGVIVMNPNMNQKDTTYLELPPDVQKLTERPKTNILSDRDRIATSKAPTVNNKDLHRILDSGRQGPPGPPNPAPVAPPQQQQQMAQAPPQQQPNQSNNGPQLPPSQTQPKLESIPGGGMSSRSNNPFSAAMSAGSSIDQAARATAGNRGVGGGAGGDYGTGGLSRPGGGVQSNLDILSDTQGVDFGPYLERVLHAVRMNWYNLIPEVARPPLMKKGKVAIEFAIQTNGQIAGMRLAGQSGDISLDRAAWGGITASNPFPPLPSEFHGSYLALRFHFYYNPGKGEMQ
jgi:TonB family protein